MSFNPLIDPKNDEICESDGCRLFAEFRDPMGNRLCSDCIQSEVGCGEYTWEECEVLE